MVDKTYGLVQKVAVTPANVYDGNMLNSLIDSTCLPEETEVLADKGYCSQANEDILKEKNLVSKIMRKKKKNQLKDTELIDYNYQISKDRYRIERSFGGLKKHYGWGRSIYMGLKKTSDYLILGALAFNLKRSIKILRA